MSSHDGLVSRDHTRSKLATDVNFIIEVSPDLTTWTPAKISESIPAETSTAQRVRATETMLLGTRQRALSANESRVQDAWERDNPEKARRMEMRYGRRRR